jgi:spore coat polysaccharide biosynthesis predicted glycosyltransferase SpsG
MRLAYCANGSRKIGTGHLFRAQRVLSELHRLTSLDATLFTAKDEASIRIVQDVPATRIELPAVADADYIKPILDATHVIEHLSHNPVDLAIVDMLDTPREDMERLRAAVPRLITFDDRGGGRHVADLIVNILVEEPDPGALPPSVRLLQGPEYAVLDRAFLSAHGMAAKIPLRDLRRVFVTLGGADATGLTVKVANALCQLDFLEHVAFNCGPAFPYRQELERVISQAPWQSEIRAGLPSLIPSYLEADLVIVAGGLTMHEVLCAGVPSLAVCQPIDHQFELAERFTGAGAMATVGYGGEATEATIADAVRALADNPSTRETMRRIGPELVDGQGTRRVAQALLDLAAGEKQ